MHFKIPYFLFKFSNHDIVKNQLIDIITKDISGPNPDKKDKISKTDWMSSKSYSSKEYFKVLIDNGFAEDINNNLRYTGIGNWQIINLWYQLYKTNDTHDWHDHGESHWSFVYYLKLPNGSKGTICKDMNTQEKIDPKQQEGDIFLFPSMIKHCSPPNLDSKEKIIISGNINPNNPQEYYD